MRKKTYFQSISECTNSNGCFRTAKPIIEKYFRFEKG